MVAVIFMFQGSYSFGMTNLITLLYPPEVLNYSTRATGMEIFTAGNFSMTYVPSIATASILVHANSSSSVQSLHYFRPADCAEAYWLQDVLYQCMLGYSTSYLHLLHVG